MAHKQQQHTAAKAEAKKTRTQQSVETASAKVPQALLVQHALAAPLPAVSAGSKLALQRTAGNRAVNRMLGQRPPTLPVQAKLTVGPANDQYEQEADYIATRVVGQMNAPQSQLSATGNGILRQQKAEDEELKRKPLAGTSQRRATAADGMEVSADVESAIQSARGSGQPLTKTVRSSMENAFGADFEGVKMHTDPRAATLNRSVQARAFTAGHDIFFGADQYQPGSKEGQKLIAHELTHVVQQNADATRRSMEENRNVQANPKETHPVSIQRKLGLELELNVLVDHGGKDAGTATKMGEHNGIELKTDHNKKLKGDKGKGEYDSIVELVTRAFEFEAFSRVNLKDNHHIEQLRADILAAKEIAEGIQAGTADFKTEKTLDTVVPGAKSDFSVGVDPSQLKTGTQNLDAYIQASFGADLAQFSELLKWAENNPVFNTKPMSDRTKGTKVGNTVKRDENEYTILRTAPTVATGIMNKLGWNGNTREFLELHGLLTIMSMYLILGQRHPKMETRRVIDKNIAPFLSRTPLHLIMNRLMNNKPILNTVGVALMKNKMGVIETILGQTGRGGDQYLIPEFSKTPQCGPWIGNVLEGKSDKFTIGLDSGAFQTMDEEGVGPDIVTEGGQSQQGLEVMGHTVNDPGTQGPVLELRQPMSKAGGRYPPNEWMSFTEYVARSLQRLNARQ